MWCVCVALHSQRDMDSFKAPILAELRVLQQEKAEMEEVNDMYISAYM